MKLRHVISVSLLLMALAACNSPQREARRMVKRAECLADTLPDSTAQLIGRVLRMPVSFSERERMDMALLQAEALMGDHGQEVPPMMDDDFFDDHAFLTTSPELERAAAYYARKKQYDKAAHAALYSGFVQQHYDEKEAAMQSLKDAEQYGKLANDSLSMAQAQYRMGGMLYDEGRYKEALDLFKAANKGFDDRYVDFAKALNSMACCYMLTGEYDSAMLCLDQGLAYADTDHSPKTRRKILNNYAVWYRKQGDYDQAIAYPTQIAHEGNLTDKDRILLNLNLGEAFAEKGETDSAAFYYGRLEQLLHDAKVEAETKVSAYNALSRFAKSQGNDSLALSYREKFEIALYEVMEQRKEQNIFRIQQQYDYESLQNEMSQKIIQRHRIIIVISALLLTAAIVIMVLQHQQKQLMKAEAELKSQIDAMKQDLKQSVKSTVMEEELTSRLRIILMANRVAITAKDPNNEWSTLVWHVMNGKGNLFEAAQANIEMIYPNLYAVITEKYPCLTKTESRLCLLSFSNLSNSEMAEMLGLSLNTVNQNRSTLRKKLNLKTEELKEHLLNEHAK